MWPVCCLLCAWFSAPGNLGTIPSCNFAPGTGLVPFSIWLTILFLSNSYFLWSGFFQVPFALRCCRSFAGNLELTDAGFPWFSFLPWPLYCFISQWMGRFLLNNQLLLLLKLEAICYTWKSKIMPWSFLKQIYNVKLLVTWFRAQWIKTKCATICRI